MSDNDEFVMSKHANWSDLYQAMIGEIGRLRGELAARSTPKQGEVAKREPNSGHGHVFPRPDGVRARCGGPGMCKECSKDAALSHAPSVEPPPQVEPAGWVSVKDRFPESGVTVLACYTNQAGRVRRIRAQWIVAKSSPANMDYSDNAEYDEEADEYYDPEGWYEQIDNWDDYSAVFVNEGEVTHWMPLPPAPKEPKP